MLIAHWGEVLVVFWGIAGLDLFRVHGALLNRIDEVPSRSVELKLLGKARQ